MSKAKKIIIVLLPIIILAAIAITIKLSINQQANNKINVTVSFYPLYDFAKNIGGDKIEVTNITPAGSEPHDFEPSVKQLAAAYKSKIFIYNGAAMEPWVDNFLKDYNNTVVKSSNNIELLKLTNNSDLSDPHFWLDPVAAIKMTDNILAGLIKVNPENEAYFVKNANTYKDKLTALDESFKNKLSKCQTDTAVTSHQAFSYLAKRYAINLVPIAGIDPSAEPDAAKLSEISDLVKSKGIKYIFFESLVSPKLAETIASETGAKTAVLDPIEGLSEDDQQKGDDYIAIQRRNLENIRTALGCE